MTALNKLMTAKEAECFLAIRRWQRNYLSQMLKRAFIPRLPLLKQFAEMGMMGKCIGGVFILIFSPLLLLAWALSALRAILVYPLLMLLTHLTPSDIRAPGERNIKGVHYQFARHIQLPPDLYIRCVDDWVGILYGKEKLPKYSLRRYLDADYLLRRSIAYDDDQGMYDLIQTQISNAREDLSNELGHY